jgi:hypothetical protein
VCFCLCCVTGLRVCFIVQMQSEIAAQKMKLALRMVSKLRFVIFMHACAHSVACCVVVLFCLSKEGAWNSGEIAVFLSIFSL